MGEKKYLQDKKLEVVGGRLVRDLGSERESDFVLAKDELLTIILSPDLRPSEKMINVYLSGRGSRAEILGLFVGRGEEKRKLIVNVIHQGQDTSAHTSIRAGLFEGSQLYFSGLIKIEKGADKTFSLLENRTLILGREARAETVPSLEIEANDVKASHAATVGRIDEAQLFYLSSRGISKDSATQLIVAGFFEPVLGKIKDEKVQAAVRKIVEAGLKRDD